MRYFAKPGFAPAALILCAAAGLAQTRVDLRGQTRNADFSSAPLTRPFRMGNSFPIIARPEKPTST